MGHIDNFKKWGNKVTKALEEDQMIAGANPQINSAIDPIAEKPIIDKITQINSQINQLRTQKEAAEKQLNDMRLAKAEELKNKVPEPTSTQVPPTV
jgi:hypothetical protein